MLTKDQVKSLQDLKQKRGRSQQGKFLIEGVHLCREALRSGVTLELLLYTQEGFEHSEVKEVVVAAQRCGVSNQRVSPGALKALADAVTPQGVMAVAREMARPHGAERGNILVLLDQVRDPGNVGTIIRTADAAGVDGVLLSRESADPFSPKVLRSTQGSIFHVPVETDIDPPAVVPELKAKGFRIFIADTRARRLHTQVRYPHRFLLAMGNETLGVRQELRLLGDDLIRVPILGRAESLNVAMAASVILYEALRQREVERNRVDIKKRRQR
jgi:TrmH family RNA methyltransferase